MIRLPFAGNVLPQNRMNNPLYKTYTGFLPRPNDDPLSPNLEPLNNYKAFQEPGHVHNKLYGNRVDYNHSDKHRFFFRWSWFHFVEKNGGWLYETFPGLQDDFKTRENTSGTLDWTYTADARTVLNFQAGGTDFLESLPKPINAQYKPSGVGLPAYMDQKCANDCALPIVDFAGYTSLGKPLANPVHWRQLNGKVNLTRVMGAHTLRAGFDTRQHFRSNRAPGAAAGQFGFSNLYTRRADDTSVYPAGDLGLSWAAFALGIPSSMVVDTNDDYAAHNPYHSWYVQNAWRVTRKPDSQLWASLRVGRRHHRALQPDDHYLRSGRPVADLGRRTGSLRRHGRWPKYPPALRRARRLELCAEPMARRELCSTARTCGCPACLRPGSSASTR